MPLIKKTSRFAKELKKPDEFITVTMWIAKFFQKHSRETIVVLSFAILGFLLWLGITTYHRYNFSSDSLLLSRTRSDLQQLSEGKTETAPDEIDKTLQRLSEKHPGSTLGVRAQVLRAKLLENKNDYLSAARIFEKCGNEWEEGKEFKSMLLLNAANDYARAGEYPQAFSIYDGLLKDASNLHNETIYIRKAEALKNSGKTDELKQFIADSMGKVNDEITKQRLMQMKESGQN